MKTIILFLFVCYCSTWADDYVYLNKIIDKNLERINNFLDVLTSYDSQMRLINYKNENISIVDGTVRSIGTISRRGDAVEWMSPDAIHKGISLGIDNMTISVQNLTINGVNYGESELFIDSPTLAIETILSTNETDCNIEVAGLSLNGGRQLIRYGDNQESVEETSLFNLSYVNGFLQSDETLNRINAYLNSIFCDDTNYWLLK